MTSDTELHRLQVETNSEEGGVTKIIEVPVRSQHDSFSWIQIAEGISSGSWAVLLTVGVVWFFSRDGIKKFMDKHMSLLDTMRKSLEENTDSLTKLADSEKAQSSTIAALQSTDQEINKTVRTANKKLDTAISLLHELRDLHEETHLPIPELLHDTPKLPAKSKRKYPTRIEVLEPEED